MSDFHPHPSHPAPAATAPRAGFAPAPSGWATAALVTAALVTLAQVASAVTSWAAADEYSLAAEVGLDARDVITTYDLVGALLMAALVAAYVATCVWLHKARKVGGSAAANPFGHQRGPVWVWLGWVVPIVNFWFPYQVVRDILDDNDALSRGMLGGWWACWLAWLLGSRVAGRLVPVQGVPDAGAVALLPWVETLLAAALLMCLVFWAQIIRDLAEAQRARVA